MILFCCASELGPPEDLSAIEVILYYYYYYYEMVFIHKKSVILICRRKYMKNGFPVFTLNGKIIDESDTVRYLGHILCNSGKDDKDIMRQSQQLYARGGKDDKDIMRQSQQLYARGNVLLRKFHMCSMRVKIQLFNTYFYIHVSCATVVEPHSR